MKRPEASWRKSSRCGTANCVEVAFLNPTTVLTRDSKQNEGPALRFGHTEWQKFLSEV
ncbi:DUF397 domain-containing protein [Actinokineospora auranticolor]|uniref:Uncharacterized protein DUF397 n=1 Tax=Actinokineospora auranticolor TaxID=155976 RepID=A0A2S6GL61_9PSEU|nr:DUF397 domain-containing protein [Actinokineospora auranticolor]PPK65967.1 uncharacterized protein DUF397 [Actinokineospora auranticolor]